MFCRCTVRHRGLSDVFLRFSDPPVKIGVVVKMKNPRRNRNWIFLPTKQFRARFPVTGFVFGHQRRSAIDAYVAECKAQLCDAWWDGRSDSRLFEYPWVLAPEGGDR